MPRRPIDVLGEEQGPSSETQIRPVQAIERLPSIAPGPQTKIVESEEDAPKMNGRIRMVQNYPVLKPQESTQHNRESLFMGGVQHITEPGGSLLPSQALQHTTKGKNVLKKAKLQTSCPLSRRPSTTRFLKKLHNRTQNGGKIAISEPFRPIHVSGSSTYEPHELTRQPVNTALSNSLEQERERRRTATLKGRSIGPEDALHSNPPNNLNVPILIVPDPEPKPIRLQVNESWKTSADQYRRENSLLQKRLDHASNTIDTLRQNNEKQYHQLKEETKMAKIEAAREKKTSDHLRWVSNVQAAKIKELEKQLEAMQAQAQTTSLAQMPENYHELPVGASQYRIRRKPCPSQPGKFVVPIELSATASHELLRLNSLEKHELPGDISQKTFLPPEENSVKMQSLPYHLPTPDLHSSFTNIFPEKENISPLDSPKSTRITLSNIRHSLNFVGEEEDPVSPIAPPESSNTMRPIFCFGSRRIEKTPAIFRIPLMEEMQKEVRKRDSGGKLIVPDMETWEWSSVPDLRLGDY